MKDYLVVKFKKIALYTWWKYASNTITNEKKLDC